MKAEDLRRLVSLLAATYPSTTTALIFSNPFELLVATILSAQTTDAQVNRVTPDLFRKFPSPAAFCRATEEEIASSIRSVNFYRTKARRIKHLAEMLVAEFGGTVPQTMDELTRLPGVARKTANVVLSQAFGKHEGIVVDTHVRRVAGRLGLTRHTDPVRIEQDLMAALPRSEWGPFSFRLIAHGRAVCTARRPSCDICVVASLCSFFRRRRR